MLVASYIYIGQFAPKDTTQLWVEPKGSGDVSLHVFSDGGWKIVGGGDGKSAYELAVEKGYSGTLDEWLDSLQGKSFTYDDLTDAQKAELAQDAVAAANRAAQAVETIEAAISDLDPSQSAEDAVVALAARQGVLENNITALGPKIDKIELKGINKIEGVPHTSISTSWLFPIELESGTTYYVRLISGDNVSFGVGSTSVWLSTGTWKTYEAAASGQAYGARGSARVDAPIVEITTSNVFKDLYDGLGSKVNTSDVANNLTTTASGKVLDARQGTALNTEISNTKLYSLAKFVGEPHSSNSTAWQFPVTLNAGTTYYVKHIAGDYGSFGAGSTSITLNTSNVWKSFTPATSGLAFIARGSSARDTAPTIELTTSDSALYDELNKKASAADVTTLKEDAFNSVAKAEGKNLFNKLEITRGYYLSSNGSITAQSSYCYSGYIKVTGGAYYTQSHKVSSTAVHFYDADFNYLSAASAPTTFQAPENASFVRVSVPLSWVNAFQLEAGQSATDYEPYNPVAQYGISNQQDGLQKIYLTCKREGTSGVDADFCGLNAIGDAVNSITDASEDKQYYILIDGHFCFKNPKMVADGGDFKYMEGGEPTPVIAKKWVHFIGIDKTRAVVEVSLDDNLASSDFPSGKTFTDYQPIYVRTSSHIKNITFVGKNVRYTSHIENNNDNGVNIHFEDCVFISKTSTKGYKSCMTIGEIPYFNLVIDNCDFINENGSTLIGGHGPLHLVTDGRENCNIQVNGCKFMTEGIIGIGVYNYNRKDQMTFRGCQFHTNARTESTSNDGSQRPIGTLIGMRFDTPALSYRNVIYSVCGLRISTTTGSGSSVRIDQTCTAFGIIGNANEPTQEILPYSAIKEYGYEYKDDPNGSHAYACGWVNIDPTTGTSLADILGDCSTINKTLSLTINGTGYNVVFNTDLSSASNADVIALINAVIGNVATCDTFNPERYQYPDFSDMEYHIQNGDSALIQSGMGVVFTDIGVMRRAKQTDGYIDGIAIDAVYPGQKGRVVMRGKFYSVYDTSPIYYARIYPTLSSLSYGQKISIDPNNDGQFVKSDAVPVLKALSNMRVEIIR